MNVIYIIYIEKAILAPGRLCCDYGVVCLIVNNVNLL